MKISIVTSVLNGRGTLGPMLDSLRAQTYPIADHIVQDGGSHDGTEEYLRAHGLRQMALRVQSDSGIYQGLNRGIARATGDVIGLLHADDRLAGPDVLAWVAEALADDRVDGVYGDLEYVSRDDPTCVVRHWKAGPYAAAKLALGWMPPHPTLYLRRRVFARCGAFDTSFRIAGDYEAILRYLTQGDVRLAYVPRVMVQMRRGGVSNRGIGNLMRKLREDHRAMRRHQIGGMGTLAAKSLIKLPQVLRPAQT